MFLMWFDDSLKKATAVKVGEAIQAYVDRFKAQPNAVLMNAEELCEIKGMQVGSETYIRKNNYWIGVGASDAPPRR